MGMQEMQMLAGLDAGAIEAAVAGVAVLGGIVALVVLFTFVFMPIVMGILCKRLARHKGYTGYFWTGFFWGIAGLVYVVGLPDLNTRKDMRAVMKRLVNVSDRVAMLEDQQAKYKRFFGRAACGRPPFLVLGKKCDLCGDERASCRQIAGGIHDG